MNHKEKQFDVNERVYGNHSLAGGQVSRITPAIFLRKADDRNFDLQYVESGVTEVVLPFKRSWRESVNLAKRAGES